MIGLSLQTLVVLGQLACRLLAGEGGSHAFGRRARLKVDATAVVHELPDSMGGYGRLHGSIHASATAGEVESYAFVRRENKYRVEVPARRANGRVPDTEAYVRRDGLVSTLQERRPKRSAVSARARQNASTKVSAGDRKNTNEKDHSQPCQTVALCMSSWNAGRLGNNIRLLKMVLLEARANNYCYIRFPPPPNTSGNPLARLIDFPRNNILKAFKSAGEPQTNTTCEKEFHLVGFHGSIPAGRVALADAVVDRRLVKCDAQSSSMMPTTQETVVMHMRSGDISANNDGYYAQPPCSYYESVLLEGNQGRPFKDGLIVTEPDQKNPCVNAMRKAFPSKIKVVSSSVINDACIMVNAKHLALSAGTWGSQLSLLNHNIQDLHIPWAGDHGAFAGHWFGESFSRENVTYEQHLYSFKGLTEKDASFKGGRLTTFPSKHIIHRVVPRSSVITALSEKVQETHRW